MTGIANPHHYCMCCEPSAPTDYDRMLLAGKRAAVLTEAYWGPNPTITVGFLEGDIELQKRVARAANEWITSGGAAVSFEFWIGGDTDPKNAMVRIAFKQGYGSWSYLGKHCLTIDRNEPTMNYGWLTPASSDLDVRSVVLHEFGHALGLIHEHQNPINAIPWNRDAVIAALSKPPNSWNLSTIEFNMFKRYEPNAVFATALDRDSIMMYPIPASWTTDGFSTAMNRDLSPADKALIQQIYFK